MLWFDAETEDLYMTVEQWAEMMKRDREYGDDRSLQVLRYVRNMLNSCKTTYILIRIINACRYLQNTI